MKPHFIVKDIIVHKKETKNNLMVSSGKDKLKSETVKVELTLTSSGDTRKISESKIAHILSNLKIE